jgi:endonuclease YncB( thermonuclease family)
MDCPITVAKVIRVTRGDTILVRCAAPQLASMVAIYLRLCGVRCKKRAREDIIDWVEMHAAYERLHLIAFDWVRDQYGRLLGDLGDIHTGERLTDYLVEMGSAEDDPDHYRDVIEAMMQSPEPDEC